MLIELSTGAGPLGGVIGSRMTGGGFGGCTISLVRSAASDPVARHLSEGYERQTGRQATVLVTGPVEGARVLRGPSGDLLRKPGQ